MYFDFELSMRRHIDVITARCYASLRQLRAIRRYTSPTVMQLLVTSLALSWLDYCNSALFGLPASSIHRLQAVQNAAARLHGLQHPAVGARHRHTRLAALVEDC